MELHGSTLIDHPAAGRRLPAARILGEGRPPEAVAALLLPMVRRAVRTGRAPSALVSWLRHQSAAADDRADGAAPLAEELARLLTGPAGSPADTRDDL